MGRVETGKIGGRDPASVQERDCSPAGMRVGAAIGFRTEAKAARPGLADGWDMECKGKRTALFRAWPELTGDWRYPYL